MVVCLISRLLAHAFRLVSVARKQKITSARVSLFHKTSSHFGTFKRKKLCQQRRAENLHFYESVFCYQTTASRKKCSLNWLWVSRWQQQYRRRWGDEETTIELVLSMAKTVQRDGKIKDFRLEEEAKKSHWIVELMSEFRCARFSLQQQMSNEFITEGGGWVVEVQ